MPAIKSIACRRVLNSHVEATNEFHVEMCDGSVGVGASPHGETIGIYEDSSAAMSLPTVTAALETDEWAGKSFDQETFDAWLEKRACSFGKNNMFALSLAFFNATRKTQAMGESGRIGVPASGGRNARSPAPAALPEALPTQSETERWDVSAEPVRPPFLCLNVLNGGWHAYTNPVLSDFPEYLLVAKSRQVAEVIDWHNEIQSRVREKLNRQPFEVVSGNLVHCFPTADNRECIEFLLGIRDEVGLAKELDLMVDASAGDLWANDGYRFSITDHSLYTCEELAAYWLDLVRDYGLRFLEDPFREMDTTSWQQLTGLQNNCYIIGDNFYSSNAGRIKAGATGRCTHGVIIKPNQAGSVTAVRRAIEAARTVGQLVITSHRSVSTEETFLSELTCAYGVSYMKIGPLHTDYSSVIRLNAILRLTEPPRYVQNHQHQHASSCQHGLQSATALCGNA